MAKITPKENFLRLRHGGMPAYVPFYSIMGDPYKGECACAGAFLPLFENTQFMNGGKDAWGVPYAAPDNLANASMPDTSVITLEDISDWTKVLQFPKPTGADIEKLYQETLTRVDRSQTALKVGPDLSNVTHCFSSVNSFAPFCIFHPNRPPSFWYKWGNPSKNRGDPAARRGSFR